MQALRIGREAVCQTPDGSPTNHWWLLDTGTGAAPYNMALDEALLDAMPRVGQAVLRFYGWTEPAVSFGYFQRYAEIEQTTLLRPLVRRPTGGGLVPHDADWTYSLVFPVIHDWFALSAVQSYRRVHEWIRSAFAVLGVATELAIDARKAQTGQCFIGHEKSDVLWHGRKIAGAAQRRTRAGLLIQGSVQPPPSTARIDWQNAMRAVAQAEQSVVWREFRPDAELHQQALHLVDRKYSRSEYNRKR